MLRKPRLDAPGLIYHVIGRGIERKAIFNDDADRYEFLRRLGVVVTDTATPVYAFALIPNHFHLLVRRGAKPISTVMRRLLTGYAVYFNKRHRRSGYLFQNRYKATICQEDTYLIQLIRYIHLNPLRAKLVSDLRELKDHPFSGHSYLMGKRHFDWFDTDTALSQFAPKRKQAIELYQDFVADGVDKKTDLSGGGLKRSLGNDQPKDKKPQAYDDRILGEGLFVERLLAHEEAALAKITARKSLSEIVSSVASSYYVTEAQLMGHSKERRIAKARAEFAHRLSEEAGMSGSEIARTLGVTKSAVSKMLAKAEKEQERVD